ncbi:MAG: recombination-associated protein RdgC [Halieaceae bacterium]|jgi:recombination associated protein RdgC|nr:recombination-associated protein RdgC [Halieaceae bacterium]
MWFKNLRAYRLSSPFDLSAEQLEAQLAGAGFTPCGKSQPASLGWVAPLGEQAELLVHAGAGRFLLCMCREERLLPTTVVREQVAQRIADIEQQEARKVYRKERLQLKDEVVQDCLPRAFTRSTRTFGYIDTRQNWLFVDAAAAGRAEEFINLLRECIGTLPLLLPQVNQSPTAAMTGWLMHSTLPQDFELGGDCELRDTGEDGGVVRCRGLELDGEEVGTHLQAGRQVTRLALGWDEKLEFLLAEDLVLRRLRFADALLDTHDDMDDADPMARLDADFVLMTDVISELQERIISVFGGEAEVS